MTKDEAPGSSLATTVELDSPEATGTLVEAQPLPEVQVLETLHQKGIQAAATSSGSHDLLRVWLRSIAAGVGGDPLSTRKGFAREAERGQRRILDLEACHDRLSGQLARLEAETLPDGTGPAAPRSLEPLKAEIAELRIRKEALLASPRRPVESRRSRNGAGRFSPPGRRSSGAASRSSTAGYRRSPPCRRCPAPAPRRTTAAPSRTPGGSVSRHWRPSGRRGPRG